MFNQTHLSLAILLLLIVGIPSAHSAAFYEEQPHQAMLKLDENTCRTFAAVPESILRCRPVAIPYGDGLYGVNDHLGWPVATQSGDALVVVFVRKPQHYAGAEYQDPDEFTSSIVMVRSVDGGNTWSPQVDLRDFALPRNYQSKTGWGNAMCTRPDGEIVLLCSYGLFTSDDGGQTWTNYPDAHSGGQLIGPKISIGPRLVQHPTYGLMIFGSDDSGQTNPDGTPLVDPEIWIRWSTDGGITWPTANQHCEPLPDIAAPTEPAGILLDRRLFILGRNHAWDSYDAVEGLWSYVQLHSAVNQIAPLTAVETNIYTTDVRDLTSGEYHGPWSQDTAALAHNPVTGRIETVVTNRDGGGQHFEHRRDCQTLNLWSIDPIDFAQGVANWRFEGTLLRRLGLMAKGQIDGMHPGGTIVDPTSGMQHIFIYAGQIPAGPAGVYMISRTLDTPALHRHLAQSYEGCHYPAGVASLDGQQGGTGFLDPWEAPRGSLNQSLALAVPDGYRHTPTAGAIEQVPPLDAKINLSHAIDMAPATETRSYFSFLFRKDDTVNATTGEYVNFILMNPDNDMLIAQLGSSETIRLFMGPDSMDAGQPVIQAGKTYLMAGRITARAAGSDELCVKAYEVGADGIDTEPQEWDATLTSDIDSVFTQLWLNSGGDFDKAYIDEIRLGTTWQDIGGQEAIPDPLADIPVRENLALWIDSAHVQQVVDTSEPAVRKVNCAYDLSGYGHHALQDAAARLPDHVSAPALGSGRKVLRFDGVDDYLQVNAADTLEADTFTWFMVLRKHENTSTSLPLLHSAYENHSSMWGNWILGSAATLCTQARTSAGDWVSLQPNGFALDQNWHIVNGVWTADRNLAHNLDNAPDVATTHQLANASPASHLHTIVAANADYGAAPDKFAPIELAELIIYARELPSIDREKVGAYLAHKYNFDTLYPTPYPADCAELWDYQMGRPEDFDRNCSIDFLDLVFLAENWLRIPGEL